MIDLCIDARMACSSGIGTFIRNLVPALSQPPFRPILLVDQLGREWCKGMEQIPFPVPIYSVKEQILFPMKIPKCDLFWSPHYNIPLFPIRAKKRIATIHDACHLALSGNFSLVETAYARFVMGRAVRGSQVAITISQFSKSELDRYFGVQGIEVIPNGMDRGHFQRVADPVRLDAVRKKYGLRDPFLLYVGNRKPHKNLSRLIAAFLAIEDSRMSSWKLVLVGKGSDPIAVDPRILTLGEVLEEDLPAVYSLAELFVFPSLYEGFGLPPLEAMSCGCPTIVSQAASLPEVCGDASVYVNPESVEDISRAISRVALNESLKQELVRKGLARVREFRWSESAEKYRKLFEEVYRA